MKVTIDAGHIKGYNVGVNPAYNEGEAMWKLSRYLGMALMEYGIEVAYTRADATKDLGVEARGKIAHDNGSDLFLSLHSDGFTSSTARGVTVFFSNCRQTSKMLAEKLGNTISVCMNTPFRGAQTRLYGGAYPNSDYYGTIRGAVGFYGERSTKVAFLIEHGFHTNPQDCAWLLQDANLKKLAQAEADAIADYYGYNIPEVPEVETEESLYWKNQYDLLRAELDDLIEKHTL